MPSQLFTATNSDTLIGTLDDAPGEAGILQLAEAVENAVLVQENAAEKLEEARRHDGLDQRALEDVGETRQPEVEGRLARRVAAGRGFPVGRQHADRPFSPPLPARGSCRFYVQVQQPRW